jgi:FAD/FMN-containing dehydrogenase
MTIVPRSPEELAESLAEAAAQNRRVTVCGNSTKDRMGGPIAPSDVTISTRGLNQVLEYNPRDLTVSVGAGISYCELSGILAEHRQMIPLDPPFSERASMGGIVAANTSGSRRRLYGTARDMVIGMTFATLEGKLIRTGGMVVKNVAGLDMGKLMIGSFGTLAVLTSLNFRLHPMPAAQRTFVQEFEQMVDVMAARDKVLQSRLQPAAIDILKLAGGYRLAIAIRARSFAGECGRARRKRRCGAVFARRRRTFSASTTMAWWCVSHACCRTSDACWSPCRFMLRLARARVFVMDISNRPPTFAIPPWASAWWSLRHKAFVNPASYGRSPEMILR